MPGGDAPAYDSAADWPDRLRAVAEAVIGGLCNDPSRASFGVEVLAAGDAPRARRDMTMRVITSLIDAGRRRWRTPSRSPAPPRKRWPAPPTARSTPRVVRGAHEELPALIPQLMATAVMPYLGVEASVEELRAGGAAGRSSGGEMAPETGNPEQTCRPSWRGCPRAATACRASSSPTTSASG